MDKNTIGYVEHMKDESPEAHDNYLKLEEYYDEDEDDFEPLNYNYLYK